MDTFRRSFSMAPLLALFVAAFAGGRADNVLEDPSFECQLAPELGGWVLFGGEFSMDYARRGKWSVYDAATNDVVGTYQELPATPGSR